MTTLNFLVLVLCFSTFIFVGNIKSSARSQETTNSSSTGCILPSLENGHLMDQSGTPLNQGESVPHLSVISYRCETGYARDSQKFNLCVNGNWLDRQHATCLKYCSNDVLHNITFKADCERKGVSVPCDEPIKAGTLARISCKVMYERPKGSKVDTLVCQENGQWDHKPSACDPICGELLTLSTPFILSSDGGTFAEITFVPWHVLIYFVTELQVLYSCGGTILSAYIVVSAAHCFHNSEKKILFNATRYVMGAGKLHGDSNKNSPTTQFRNISKISIPLEYSHENFAGDIAFLLLEKPLQFTPVIAPICIEWLKDDEVSFANNLEGYITTYVYLERSSAYDVNSIRFVNVSATRYQECRALEIPITSDHFCTRTWCNDDLPCRDISGTGFVQQISKNGKIKHYLSGIVSLFDITKHRIDDWISFTNIQFFKHLYNNVIKFF